MSPTCLNSKGWTKIQDAIRQRAIAEKTSQDVADREEQSEERQAASTDEPEKRNGRETRPQSGNV